MGLRNANHAIGVLALTGSVSILESETLESKKRKGKLVNLPLLNGTSQARIAETRIGNTLIPFTSSITLPLNASERPF